MLEDNFSAMIDMYLTPMTIMPELCTISYECTSIDEDGEASSSISCDDLMKDLVFDGDERRRL